MILHLAKEFTDTPAGRYVTDGPYSGEAFREKLLKPALDDNDVVEVDLDGVEGYGSSFLEEAFGGLIRRGYFSRNELKRKLRLKTTDEALKVEVFSYIDSAQPENRG